MKKVAKKYSNKGITLVTLVVTIIVLIILAGVSINLMLGEKGIITIAKQAKENTELAKIEEETRLNELYMQIEAEGIGSGEISYDAIAKLVEFKREIASAITDMGITTAENADASTMSSNIRSISGASSADKVRYDNTNSGLTATNVQGAVDELNSRLESLESLISASNVNDYSTEEKVVGTWIDGRPFYRKTFVYTTTSHSLALPNSIIENIDFVIAINGATYDSGGSLALNYYKASDDYFRGWYTHNVGVQVRKSGSGNVTYVMTLDYTKTTN